MKTPQFELTQLHLRAREAKPMRAFYEDILQLVPVAESPTHVEYATSADAKAFLHLTFDTHALKEGLAAGLYHFAILVKERATLASILQQLLSKNYPLIGAGDHLVSEALYLEDPEGNGIELYYDRPASEWTWRGTDVEMATLPVDVDELLLHATSWHGFPDSTKLGHLHFYGSQVADGDALFVDILQMDITAEMGAHAHFYSNNKYHHHVALNVWRGRGIPLHNPNNLGIIEWHASVDEAYFELIEENLQIGGRTYQRDGHKIITTDAVGANLVIEY